MRPFFLFLSMFLVIPVWSCTDSADPDAPSASRKKEYQLKLGQQDQQKNKANEEQDDADKLFKKTLELQKLFEAQLRQASNHTDRMESLIERWEKQADRYDALLKKWEKNQKDNQ